MNKKLKKINAIFICIILSSSSCAKEKHVENGIAQDGNTIVVNTGESVSKADSFIAETLSEKPEDSSYTEDTQPHLTYEQAINDCEFLFDSLRNDYPFEGILYRKYGLTLDSIKTKFVKNLTKHKNDMNINIHAAHIIIFRQKVAEVF